MKGISFHIKGMSFRHLLTVPCLFSLSRVFPFGITMLIMWQLGFSKLSIAFVGILASPTDFLDGYIARKYNCCTRTGELLDPLCDKFLLACAAVIVSGEINFALLVYLITSESLFLIVPIAGAFATEKSVASLWPGKIRLNLQCLGMILLYCEQPWWGHVSLIASIPFAALTIYQGMKIVWPVIKQMIRTILDRLNK